MEYIHKGFIAPIKQRQINQPLWTMVAVIIFMTIVCGVETALIILRNCEVAS